MIDIDIDTKRYRLPAKNYSAEKHTKTAIVVHFTAGSSAAGAFNTFAASKHGIATAYIIERDGTIYELFPPECWAKHLGILGDRNAQDKRTIGIEVVNVGPLKLDKENLNFWPPDMKFQTKYCTVREESAYMQTGKFRGYSYFATFPEMQTSACRDLIHYLCDRFNIPLELPGEMAGVYDFKWARAHHGVLGHDNFRAGKFDPGPAFPWEDMAVKNEEYSAE